jgi:hypothetical protein
MSDEAMSPPLHPASADTRQPASISNLAPIPKARRSLIPRYAVSRGRCRSAGAPANRQRTRRYD